ncbi:hypothetical protein CIL05_10290 [Virgibacillus profundi]|uniref:Uncharacterized protein n=1 Tax=Virgibacillus profundi TaxID=2024555 RepID=A0A2A2IEK8_9BACI|nr:hypothetical protein [Virgibacillus profundi]PAV29746.1 hypothetical protein CIL05_10290 [Virgibacillus profundi]PXY53918.1 hypothetical protein CIT14_10395 [Virgibacillus profundi]
MLTNRQSTVVDSTLRELFFRNKKPAVNAHSKTVLVLLFYHMNGLERDLKELNDLHENNIRVRICPDEQILDHYDVNDLAKLTGIDDWISMKDVETQKEQFDHFYIPILPFSTVSDLLNFNDVRPSIRIVLWALMRGRQVSTFSAGADPYHTIWQELGLNHGTANLKVEMKKQLQQIRGFGIQLVENENNLIDHFLTSFQKNKNQVITANMIIKLAKAGRSYMEIDQQTIITPLARDTARKYQVEIGREKGR